MQIRSVPDAVKKAIEIPAESCRSEHKYRNVQALCEMYLLTHPSGYSWAYDPKLRTLSEQCLSHV